MVKLQIPMVFVVDSILVVSTFPLDSTRLLRTMERFWVEMEGRLSFELEVPPYPYCRVCWRGKESRESEELPDYILPTGSIKGKNKLEHVSPFSFELGALAEQKYWGHSKLGC
jgi:hypothetical protein